MVNHRKILRSTKIEEIIKGSSRPEKLFIIVVIKANIRVEKSHSIIIIIVKAIHIQIIGTFNACKHGSYDRIGLRWVRAIVVNAWCNKIIGAQVRLCRSWQAKIGSMDAMDAIRGMIQRIRNACDLGWRWDSITTSKIEPWKRL